GFSVSNLARSCSVTFPAGSVERRMISICSITHHLFKSRKTLFRFSVNQSFYFSDQIIIGFATENATIKFCLFFKQAIIIARHKQERDRDSFLTNFYE